MTEDLANKSPETDSEKLTLILTTVQTMTSRVGTLEDRFGGLEQRFDGLERKVYERLYDTRPIWEKVVVDITQLQKTVEQMQTAQETLLSDSEEIKMSARHISGRLDILTDAVVGAQIRNRDIEMRLKALELEHNPPKPQT